MSLFKKNLHGAIQENVLTLLNSGGDALGLTPRSSPRSVGDGVEDYIKQNLNDILPEYFYEFETEFSRHAMQDFAFRDRDGNYYAVDIKTHRLSTKFNMPNLISVKRLSDFYDEPTNFFTVLYLSYEFAANEWVFKECKFAPIEHFEWSSLTVGLLGWGQIQLKNANAISIAPQSRRQWMLDLYNKLLEFYPREIGKLQTRLSHFKSIRERWLKRSDEQS